MNPNTSEYILAQLKRTIILALERTRNAQRAYVEGHKYTSTALEAREATFRQVLEMLTTIEADAVLGEPSITDEQYATIGEEEQK